MKPVMPCGIAPNANVPLGSGWLYLAVDVWSQDWTLASLARAQSWVQAHRTHELLMARITEVLSGMLPWTWCCSGGAGAVHALGADFCVVARLLSWAVNVTLIYSTPANAELENSFPVRNSWSFLLSGMAPVSSYRDLCMIREKYWQTERSKTLLEFTQPIPILWFRS